MKHSLQYAALVGRMAFPIDMLRYDSCFPLTEGADSSAVLRSFDHGSKEPWVVVVAKWKCQGGGFTPDRWRSFGCKFFGPYDSEYTARQTAQQSIEPGEAVRP